MGFRAFFDVLRSYQAVLNSLKHPPVGVYDDHDYGLNGAGADFDGKFESQQLFLDFLGESNSSERRRRNGLYGFQSFGPVTLLFLDVRFFETSSSRLGDEQWKFVESFFATDREGEKVIVVVSSIQAITGYDRPLQEGGTKLKCDLVVHLSSFFFSFKDGLIIPNAEEDC